MPLFSGGEVLSFPAIQDMSFSESRTPFLALRPAIHARGVVLCLFVLIGQLFLAAGHVHVSEVHSTCAAHPGDPVFLGGEDSHSHGPTGGQECHSCPLCQLSSSFEQVVWSPCVDLVEHYVSCSTVLPFLVEPLRRRSGDLSGVAPRAPPGFS